jgi:hypothetical protein
MELTRRFAQPLTQREPVAARKAMRNKEIRSSQISLTEGTVKEYLFAISERLSQELDRTSSVGSRRSVEIAA